MTNRSILLIGKPGSSKTVYLAQFYLRLQKRKSKLALADVVKNITVLSPALEALANGQTPEPTNTEANKKFLLPVKKREERFDLLCPEYGGEQVNTIIRTRSLDKEWLDAVKNCDNWLMFIRLNGVSKAKDLSDLTVSEQTSSHSIDHEHPEYEVSDQVSFIELLQILLFHRQHNYHDSQKKIRLTIALTCWDELETKDIPVEHLKKHMPLFTEFVESNWSSAMWSVFGLAALECSLKELKDQEGFQINGPESYGFIINPDGTDSKDITELISEAV
ncbi:hypothetical protein SAMN04489724_3015 [Algoriphagus locisalis]|uniref:Double-GTPase 1 domain-containing protein n=1 Tax=Algoriphagus locisalis TaxID=305507 RepID=A0A1I7CAQ3_9BACT|nr:hypothetical protein [Algoriphagus locisalis]SFT96477.1 hypothetical protein SAMN04489724_3015 [Algoriphagus locisalis]